MNKTYLLGKVSDKGPRHNKVKGDREVSDFTVVTSHPTNYLDVTLWESPVAHHLAPGDLVFVEGSGRHGKYSSSSQLGSILINPKMHVASPKCVAPGNA